MNVSAPQINARWRHKITHFLKWIREDRRWRRHWIIFGYKFTCVGVIMPRTRHANDNGPRP
jgi:hypothetical protein